MMVKKYTGQTTRETLRKMREDLGNDAMILSSKQTPNGIEMMAMAQGEVNQLIDASDGFTSVQPETMSRQKVRVAPLEESRSATQKIHRGVTPLPQRKTLRDLAVEVASDSPQILRVATNPATVGTTAPTSASAPAVWRQTRALPAVSSTAAGTSHAAMSADPMVDVSRAMQQASAEQARFAQHETNALIRAEPNTTTASTTDPALIAEMKNMRAMLESQLAGLTWRELLQGNPLRTRCWSDLTEAGFSATFARTVAEHAPDHAELQQVRQWLEAVLLRNLPQVEAGQDLVERGGVWALVGSTGVGKTTTTAKLAARCVVKYGVNSLGLITTDTYRVGAHDQLKVYAKILGIQVYSAQASSDLQSMLNFMSRRRLVLIDSAGMGQRDSRLEEQMAMLSEPAISRVLLLNASAQSETLEDVVHAYGTKYSSKYGGQPLAGALMTKLDEAVKIGAVLDTLIRHRLPLHFVTDGQRVPEDLHIANPHLLVQRALKPATQPTVSPNLSDLIFDMLPTAAVDTPMVASLS